MSRAGMNALRGCLAVPSPFVLAAPLVAIALPDFFAFLQNAAEQRWSWALPAGYALFGLLADVVGVWAQRLPHGVPGRLRSLAFGHGMAAFAAATAALWILLIRAAPDLPFGTPIGLEEALALFPQPLRRTLSGLIGSMIVTAGVVLVSLVGLWFLLPGGLRRALFWIFDAALTGVFVWLTARFGFEPASTAPHDLIGPSARLVVTFLLGVRIGARLLPHVLDLIEAFDFRALVAARHLRAKKSGFLAAISFLSILAVSVSSCALTTTLSVMGGFRQDLKRKILGNNAHIVIDRAHGRIADWTPLITRTREVPGVTGVSSYVSGEVMISSASNLAGAVLRGIDVEHIGEVSELPKNMKIGSLDYLAHPDKLTRLPPSQLGLSLGLPSVKHLDTEPDAPDQAARLTKELAKLLDEDAGVGLDDDEIAPPTPPQQATKPPSLAGAPSLRNPAEPAPPPAAASGFESLPGIVVGQELARSLRLYLGDEVNVVTPLGELGPTGPMPKSRPFRVAGIFYSGMYEYDMKFAYVSLASAQKFLGAGDQVSGIEVTVREPERAQEQAQAIAGTLGRSELRVRGWQELNQNLFGALALEKLAMFIALGIAILVASFCIIGTLTLMVQEKGREVAVLKAMGAGDRAIVSIFVLEGTLIGVFGSLLGLALGYVACFAMEHFGVRLNPEVYYIDRLPVHTDSSEFLAVGVAAILVCLIVTIYPAQLASRLRPVDALRYE